jgi:hypothetical protein
MSSASVETARWLHLPKHVCACRTDDGIVFLDTRHDRYMGLGGASALADVVCNWPGREDVGGVEVSTLSPELREVADALIQRGLLAEGLSNDVPRARAVAPALEMRAPGELVAATYRRTRLVDVARFLAAWGKAVWALRRRSLESIELDLHWAREKSHSEREPDVDATVKLAQIFFRLRRLAFSEKNRCLLSALSLVYFLRPYGHFPHLVVGVKTGPFAAHSWVQQGKTVLDGEPASVCYFVPILVA